MQLVPQHTAVSRGNIERQAGLRIILPSPYSKIMLLSLPRCLPITPPSLLSDIHWDGMAASLTADYWQNPLRASPSTTPSPPSGGLWCQPGKRPSPKVNPQRIEPFPVRTLLPGGVLGARHAPPLGTDHCSAFPKHCGWFFSPSPQRCTKRPQRRSALCGQSRESPELRAVSGSVFGVPRQSVSGEGSRRCRGCLTAVLGVPEGDVGVPEGNARGPRRPVPLPRESRRGLALQHHPAPPGGAARGLGRGGPSHETGAAVAGRPGQDCGRGAVIG